MSNFPEHIQWIVTNLGIRLKNAAVKENLNISVEDILQVLISADPTKDKNLVDWLAKTWISGGFLWEDVCQGKISKAWNTLDLFDRNQTYLSVKERNLYNYKRLSEVWTAIQGFETKELESGKEIKRNERKRALEETNVVYRDNSLIIAIPLSIRASQWWGRGTQWCTAAKNSGRNDDNHAFNQYASIAPIFVITLLAGESTRKFQLWFEKESHRNIQFMDETDTPITLDTISNYWAQLEPFMRWALKESATMIQYFPDNTLTREEYSQIILGFPQGIRYIPKEYLDHAVLKQTVSKKGSSLSYIPKELRDIELCTLAVTQNGFCLKYVPEHLKSKELCWLAVTNNSSAIFDVPDSIESVELWTAAIKNAGEYLEYLPARFIGKEICKLAINKFALAIKWVPESLLDLEMCRIALEADINSLNFIPERFKSEINTILPGIKWKEFDLQGLTDCLNVDAPQHSIGFK